VEIRFQGLIAFAKVGNELLAVLMNYSQHDPILSIPKPAYDEDNSTVTPDFSSGNKKCFVLEGHVGTSLGSGIPPTGDITDVPQMLKGFPQGINPHASLTSGSLDLSRFSAVFHFPPVGMLSPLGYYAKQGDFNAQKHGCIPRSLSLTFPFSGPLTFYMNGDMSKKVIVKLDVVVAITNGSTTSAGGHYSAYANFFKEPSTTIYTPTNNANDCTKNPNALPVPACSQPTDLEVDCSPVRYP